MAWLEFDESADFRKNKEAKRETTNSESDSDSGSNVLVYYVQPSAVSTFTTKKINARNYITVKGSDEASAFTQSTQDTIETRIVKIETQIEDLATSLTMLLKNSETKQQLQADLQSRNNQEKMNQLQEALNQMIKIFI